MQVTRALASEQSRAPRAFKKEPAAERNLSDKLAGKKICIAIDDPDFQHLKGVISDILAMASSSSRVTLTGWTDLLIDLPKSSYDLLIILSPRKILIDIEDYEKGLAAFKRANPKSVVVMSNLHSPASVQTGLLRELKDASLIDHIEQGFAFFPILLHTGAERLEGKA